MIRLLPYRWVNVFLGSRSFKKYSNNGITYVLVKGDSNKIINILLSQGFIEEFTNNKYKGEK